MTDEQIEVDSVSGIDSSHSDVAFVVIMIIVFFIMIILFV